MTFIIGGILGIVTGIIAIIIFIIYEDRKYRRDYIRQVEEARQK